ncbi:unnamed protein product [Adineta steineri]|uniref:EXPERA domain-containing protein n=1 Tax=Adineta steineri TaxID=433720 RepID=A0A819M6F5_9BILA|nr:unnamed protein product [Adineta steineri]
MPSKSNTNTRSNQCYMPLWITEWAIVSSLICIWDATYVLTRPRSMAKGDLFHLFSPYATYITVDPLYGNLKNAFVIGQSWMNYVELTLALYAVILYHIFKRKNSGCLLLLIASVMSCSKTVLYFIHDYYERSLHPHDSPYEIETWQYLLLFIIPSSLWIIFPFCCTWTLGRQIIKILDSSNDKTKSA